MYNAFISYSHAADGRMAPALQNALVKFAKPWYKKPVLNIFRDESSLSATPHLWSNIQNALDQSEYLVYMASPESAASHWVNKEIEYWLANKPLDAILIVLTDGEIEWDFGTETFSNPSLNSLPKALDNAFKQTPFYIDLRSYRTEEDLSLKNSLFKKEVLKLAAQLHGKEPKELAGEDVKAQQRWVRIRTIAIVLLTALLGVSIIQTIESKKQESKAIANMNLAIKNDSIAQIERINAENQTRKAISSGLTATSNQFNQSDPTISFRLAEYAIQFDSANTNSYAALLRAFYANPYTFGEKLHGSALYLGKQHNIPAPKLRKQNVDFNMRPSRRLSNFLKNKESVFEYEHYLLANTFYSPSRRFVMLYFTPEADYAAYRIEIWDLKDEFNNYPKRSYGTPKESAPIYEQYLSYTQIDGFSNSNFSFDNRYVVVPNNNKALVINLTGRRDDKINEKQLTVGSSNSQVVQTYFNQSDHKIGTINLNGDTATFDLDHLTIPILTYSKNKDFYSDQSGLFVIAAEGKSAQIWNLKGDYLGKAKLNDEKTAFTSAPEGVDGWEQMQLTQFLSKSYYGGYVEYDDTLAVSSDGNLVMNGSVISDKNGNELLTLTGHSERISSVDISDNKQLFITSTCPKLTEPETKLWDKEGNELMTISNYGGKVGFLPGGKAIYIYLVSCCVECEYGYNISIWPIDQELLIDFVNNINIHQLTQEEIERYGIVLELLKKE